MAKGEEDMSSFLEQWILHDGKPITARLLSTLKRCHISTAHKNMATFYDNMSKRGPDFIPFTSWIIKGPLKIASKAAVDSQTSIDSMDVDEEDHVKAPLVRESLLLVTQEKLKDTEAKFERITVKQVYSFSPRLPAKHTEAHKVAAISQLTTIQHDLHTSKDYVDIWESTGRGAQLGTIQSIEEWEDSGQSKSLASSTAGSSKTIAAATSMMKKEPSKEVKKEEKGPMEKPVKKTEALSFAKAKGGPKSKRKLIESDDEEEEASTKEADKMEEEDEDDDDAGPIGYAVIPSEGQDDEATKGGKAVRKRADAGDKLSKDEVKRRRQKQELMDMMDEDDDDAGNADPPAIKMAETSSTSMMKGTEDTAVGSKAGDEERDSTVPGPRRRVRKQRKVIKKVKSKDSKGYTRTQDVEEYESYSSDESDTPAAAPLTKTATKKQPPQKEKEAPPMAKTNSGSGASSAGNSASKKIATAPATGGQRKLSSFFTKN